MGRRDGPIEAWRGMTKEKFYKANRAERCIKCRRPTWSRCDWDQAVCSSKTCRSAHKKSCGYTPRVSGVKSKKQRSAEPTAHRKTSLKRLDVDALLRRLA